MMKNLKFIIQELKPNIIRGFIKHTLDYYENCHNLIDVE